MGSDSSIGAVSSAVLDQYVGLLFFSSFPMLMGDSIVSLDVGRGDDDGLLCVMAFDVVAAAPSSKMMSSLALVTLSSIPSASAKNEFVVFVAEVVRRSLFNDGIIGFLTCW